ncbi:MAG TPA: hypothetical protein PKA68_06760, partial [Arachnia sp.]|nr:hypothetical protein [Arachnia sp.]
MSIVVVVAVIVALHSSLARIVMPLEGQQTLDHGGSEATLHLGSLTVNDPEVAVASAETDAARIDPNACTSINAILSTSVASNHTTAFTESTPCEPSAFGWTLRDGTWPTSPGEVAVSTATGWKTGDELPAGLLPVDVDVVAVVENRWATDSHTIIAAPGTWQSFGWPNVSQRFPRLGATLSVHTTVENAHALAASRGASGSSVLVDAVGERSSLSESQPILYRFPAFALGIAAMALVLALRGRTRARRNTLLVSQGVPGRAAMATAHLGDIWVMCAAAMTGVALGSTLALPLTPLLRHVAGHELSPIPLPIDPVLRGVLPGLGLALLYGLLQVYSVGRPQRRSREEPRSTTARSVLNNASSGEDAPGGMKYDPQILDAYWTYPSRDGGRRSPDLVRRSRGMIV